MPGASANPLRETTLPAALLAGDTVVAFAGLTLGYWLRYNSALGVLGLDVPDAVCKARLRQRNAAGTHEFTVSDAEFDEITGYLVPPSADEGFETTVYRDA